MKFIRYCQMIWSLLRSEDENKPQRRQRGNRRTARQRLVAPDRQKVHKTPDTPKIRAEEQAERLRHNLRLVGLAAMVVTMGTVVFLAVRETVFNNPRLAVREIYVTPEDGHEMLTPTQIKEASGLREGENLLVVNLRDVREKLMQMPAISKVSVEHDFAGKITITPTQRRPVAWVKCDHLHWVPMRVGQGLLVDADGRAIRADTVLPEYAQLPVIDDDTIDQITLGALIVSPRFVASLDLMKQLVERQSRDGQALKSIQVKNKFALIATFDTGFTATFSYDSIGPEMKRYDQFVAAVRGREPKARAINLAAELNIPVVFEVAQVKEAPPPPTPTRTSVSSTRSSSRSASSSSTRPRNSGKTRKTKS
jgi:cell division septal protein FtsQ